MPTPLPPESCATCRYFLNTNGDGGRCRRYPPSLPAGFEETSAKGHFEMTAAENPYVLDDEWCGEYQRLAR